MKLTALEIKQQTFEKSLRGYDPSEVNAFLSLIASEWEHMTAKIRDLEEEVEKMNKKLVHYERVEEALHETLQTARESAEHKMEDAKKDARNLLEKSEMEANGIIRDASQQRQQIRQSILRLLDRREEIIGGIKSYLELAQESLQQFSRDEAALFDISDDSDLNVYTRIREPAEIETPETEESGKRDKEEKPKRGTETMDDILDEID